MLPLNFILLIDVTFSTPRLVKNSYQSELQTSAPRSVSLMRVRQLRRLIKPYLSTGEDLGELKIYPNFGSGATSKLLPYREASRMKPLRIFVLSR